MFALKQLSDEEFPRGVDFFSQLMSKGYFPTSPGQAIIQWTKQEEGKHPVHLSFSWQNLLIQRDQNTLDNVRVIMMNGGKGMLFEFDAFCETQGIVLKTPARPLGSYASTPEKDLAQS